MLDPLTAIGLAGAILQFVDIGRKLLVEGIDIYQSASGAVTEHVAIEFVVTEINLLNSKLSIPASTDFQGSRTQKVSDDEEAIQARAGSCKTIVHELLLVLEDLKVQQNKGFRRKWETFRKAVTCQAPWNPQKIQSLERRLDRLQRQISRRLLVMMRY